jgi:hypothetical protein
MRQTFEKVAPGIYQRTYVKVGGERSVLFYGRLKNKKTQPGAFPLVLAKADKVIK